MITLILILLGIAIWACKKMYDKELGEEWDMLAFVLALFLAVGISIELVIIYESAKTTLIDEKIQLYEIQNEKIESQIEETVESYMTYENTTFKDLKVDNYMAAVNVYPELKSNTLVREQITLYTENNDKIVELKEKQIDKKRYKFLLYFGK